MRSNEEHRRRELAKTLRRDALEVEARERSPSVGRHHDEGWVELVGHPSNHVGRRAHLDSRLGSVPGCPQWRGYVLQILPRPILRALMGRAPVWSPGRVALATRLR